MEQGSTASAGTRRTSGGVGTPSNRVLSCANCRRRKILCNKETPCANCIKNNVTCVPSRPAPSRPRLKSTPQDIRERLAKCEALLQDYVAVDHNSQIPSEQQSTTTGNGDILPASSEATVESARRYVDGDLWVTLHDEIRKMRNLVEQDQPEIAFSEDGTHDDLSGYETPKITDFPTLNPTTAFKLWQIYLERVNPLLKIVHAPTVQPLIVSATADIKSIPLDQQALVYSIFGLAISALRSDEVTNILGAAKQRDQILQGFLTAVSVSLAHFGSLRQYNMVVLQALLHTSVSFDGFSARNESRLTLKIILSSQCNKPAAWILLGTLLRIAISLGYHRDGTNLLLSPFETEMRRRIWWQIVFFDIKISIDSGLRHSSVPEYFDTKSPLNLNDADLFPDATDPLVHKEGPTEMAFVLVINRISAYLLDKKARQTMEANILGHRGDRGSIDTSFLNHNRLLVQQLETDLVEIERKFIPSAASTIHAAALAIRPHLIRRLHDISHPMQESPDWGTDVLSPRDSLFKLSLSSCENASNSYELMDRWGFAWYIRLHFNFEILASLATFLYHSPTSSLANRGWAVLDSLYAKQSLLDTHRPNAAVTPSQFLLKAFSERERILAETGQVVEVPELIATLRQMSQLHNVTPPAPSNANTWTGAVESISSNFMHLDGTHRSEDFITQADTGEGVNERYDLWPGALWNTDWGQSYGESALN